MQTCCSTWALWGRHLTAWCPARAAWARDSWSPCRPGPPRWSRGRWRPAPGRSRAPGWPVSRSPATLLEEQSRSEGGISSNYKYVFLSIYNLSPFSDILCCIKLSDIPRSLTKRQQWNGNPLFIWQIPDCQCPSPFYPALYLQQLQLALQRRFYC